MKEKNSKSCKLSILLFMAVFSLCLGLSSVFENGLLKADAANISDNGDKYIFTDDVDSAKSKPVINVSKTTIDADSAKGKIVNVDIDISGKNIDKKFCTTGFHIFWDDRLTLVPVDSKTPAYAGNAINGMSYEMVIINEKNGLMFATCDSADNGISGNLLTLQFKLPDNAKSGDVYPIDIAYQSKPLMSDLFTNNKDDSDGRLMQAWFFTKGINSADNPSDDSLLKRKSRDLAIFTKSY